MQVHGDLHDAGGSLDPKITGLQSAKKAKETPGSFFLPFLCQGQRDYLKHMMIFALECLCCLSLFKLVWFEQVQCRAWSLLSLVAEIRSLADECASYLVLGLDGPSATADEIKKAYRHSAYSNDYPVMGRFELRIWGGCTSKHFLR